MRDLYLTRIFIPTFSWRKEQIFNEKLFQLTAKGYQKYHLPRRHCHVLEMVEVKGVTYPVMSVVPTEEEEYIPYTAVDKINALINGEKI